MVPVIPVVIAFFTLGNPDSITMNALALFHLHFQHIIGLPLYTFEYVVAASILLSGFYCGY
jgi:hypothetical protein